MFERVHIYSYYADTFLFIKSFFQPSFKKIRSKVICFFEMINFIQERFKKVSAHMFLYVFS